MLSIFQSQFTEKGFKKAENSEQNGVLLLFLFTLETRIKTPKWVQEWRQGNLWKRNQQNRKEEHRSRRRRKRTDCTSRSTKLVFLLLVRKKGWQDKKCRDKRREEKEQVTQDNKMVPPIEAGGQTPGSSGNGKFSLQKEVQTTSNTPAFMPSCVCQAVRKAKENVPENQLSLLWWSTGWWTPSLPARGRP